jgi:ABC-type multidrug transport system permease subunit
MFKFRRHLRNDAAAENNMLKKNLAEDISVHIFLTSATMIGICLTIISISKAVFYFKAIETITDDLLSIDALLFLAACVLSYVALRTRTSNRHRAIEKIADGIFLVALFLMALTCCLITYAFV